MTTSMSEGSLGEHDNRVGRLVQHIRGVRHSIVLTEGSRDLFVLENTVDPEQLFDVAGRNNVLSITEKILQAGETRFVSVFDRDFSEDRYDEDGPHFPYYENDLESMLIEMGLLADLIRIRGSELKINGQGGAGAIIDTPKKVVAPISSLRRANALNRWGLDFDGSDLAKFIQQKTLVLDVDRYCASLYNARLRAGDGGPELIEIIDAAKGPAYQPLYRGKDLVIVASVALREYAGGLNKAQADPDALIEAMHMTAKHALPVSIWARSLQAKLTSRSVN